MARRAKTVGRLRIKRVYEPAAKDDGARVLVDRLWPRGLTKRKAQIDEWLKDVAPSHELRRRFHGDREKWKEFVAAYSNELRDEPARSAIVKLQTLLQGGRLTLLYGSRDEERNHAVALKGWLERRRRRR